MSAIPLRQHCLRQGMRQAQSVAQIEQGQAADVVGDALAIIGHYESLLD